MNRAPLIAFIGLLGLYALLPAIAWTKPHLPPAPVSRVPSFDHVQRCQMLAAHWTPGTAHPHLAAWRRCMRLDR